MGYIKSGACNFDLVQNHTFQINKRFHILLGIFATFNSFNSFNFVRTILDEKSLWVGKKTNTKV